MIKNIIFSGGAFKGWAHIGTLRALNELVEYKYIDTVTGVSIGSFFALLYILQINYLDILEYCINIDFNELIDINIDDIVINHSLINGNKYREYIKEIISIKIDPDVTFKELYIYSRIKLNITALNINKQEYEVFNYINTPDIKLIDAILASSALPILFPPVIIKNQYYYDGGLYINCPSHMVPELSSICFSLDINATVSSNSNPLIGLICTLIKLSDEDKKKYIDGNDIIFQILDSRFANQMLNINQTKDEIFNLYMKGYINSKNVIYDNFKAIKG